MHPNHHLLIFLYYRMINKSRSVCEHQDEVKQLPWFFYAVTISELLLIFHGNFWSTESQRERDFHILTSKKAPTVPIYPTVTVLLKAFFYIRIWMSVYVKCIAMTVNLIIVAYNVHYDTSHFLVCYLLSVYISFTFLNKIHFQVC